MQPPIWPQVILQIVLILLHACLTAAEAAERVLSTPLLRRQAEEGDKRYLRVVAPPGRFRATVRMGSILLTLLGAAFATDCFAGRLSDWAAARYALASVTVVHGLSVAVVALVLALLYLLLGEWVPKRLAVHWPEQTAKAAFGPAEVVSWLLSPLLWLLTAVTNGLLRPLHIDPADQGADLFAEEMRMMMDLGEEKGAIQTGEREMIDNILSFNNMTAGDVMVHRTDMTMLWVQDTDEEIVRTIEETGLSRYPVYDEDADDVIGILNSRAYFLNARQPNPQSVREILREAYFVPETVRADVLFRDMQSKKIHMAIVVDEYGGTSGLVTMEDLLEEIVGKIYDEFDPLDELEIIPLGENLWRVAGAADLEDVAKALAVDIPEDEEAETLGGLVFAQLSVIPEDGSHPEVETHGLHIRVERLSDRRVEWAMVSKLPPQEEET